MTYTPRALPAYKWRTGYTLLCPDVHRIEVHSRFANSECRGHEKLRGHENWHAASITQT